MINLEELSNQELACIEARSKDRLRDIEDDNVEVKVIHDIENVIDF